MTITEAYKRDLYKYIFGILKNKGCFVHRINGIPNHIHLLIDLHPSVALADLVKEIKRSSHQWLKNNTQFPFFDSWGQGYYATSLSPEGIEICKSYIMSQEEHHFHHDLLEEMQEMALLSGLSWHKDDWQ